ncbi:hypothetical protein LXL04_008900 [Taraxacum kok-saghyz]
MNQGTNLERRKTQTINDSHVNMKYANFIVNLKYENFINKRGVPFYGVGSGSPVSCPIEISEPLSCCDVGLSVLPFSVLSAYYRGAMGIQLVYDVTDESSSFNNTGWNKAHMDESKRYWASNSGCQPGENPPQMLPARVETLTFHTEGPINPGGSNENDYQTGERGNES